MRRNLNFYGNRGALRSPRGDCGMRIRLVWAVLVALPLILGSGDRLFGAEQAYPDLMGGPDSPAPAKSGAKASKPSKPSSNGKEAGSTDLSSKPWRSIDVDIPESEKKAKKRTERKPEPEKKAERRTDRTPGPKKKAQRRTAGKSQPKRRDAPVRKRRRIAEERPVEVLRPRPEPRSRCEEMPYGTKFERVLVEPGRVSERVRPARYRTVREQVEVRPAQVGYLVYPAEYHIVRERVLVRPGKRRVVRVPAQYREELRRVTVSGPRRGWVRERVGNHYAWVPATLPPQTRVQLVRIPVSGARRMVVEEPAVYETRTRRVLVAPERRERVTLAAEYRTVTRKVLVEPPRRERVVVPARYKTVGRRIPRATAAHRRTIANPR